MRDMNSYNDQEREHITTMLNELSVGTAPTASVKIGRDYVPIIPVVDVEKATRERKIGNDKEN